MSKITFVGVVLLLVRKPHCHHHTTTNPRFSLQFEQLEINYVKWKNGLNNWKMEDDLDILENGRRLSKKIIKSKTVYKEYE